MAFIDFVDETGSTKWDGDVRETSAGYLSQATGPLLRAPSRRTYPTSTNVFFIACPMHCIAALDRI